MTHRNVETLLGRLLTDPLLRRRFAVDPAAVLEEFRTQGHDLTLVELEALASTDPRALRSTADSLDRRIQRVAVEPQPDAQDEQEER